MNPSTREAAFAHAGAEYPRESCGVVIVVKGKERYHPCRNLARSGDEFLIHPEDLAEAEDLGELVRIVHSHPDAPALPSDPDRLGCERTRLPWTILGVPSGAYFDMVPTGWEAPLVGRRYFYGTLDCFSLIRDYYARVQGIQLRDYPRTKDWWKQGLNLYEDNWAAEGFTEIQARDLRAGDLILLAIRSTVPNHAAVYLGGDVILQHLESRLSSRDVWGGYWRKCARRFLRHRDLLNPVEGLPC